MVRLKQLACRVASFVAAFIAIGIPNSLLARDYYSCRRIDRRDCIHHHHYHYYYHHYHHHHVILTPASAILETGYSLLKDIGEEVPGYGLYSYAIMVNDNDRSAKFLRDVFNAITPVGETAAERSRTNIFYVPLEYNKAGVITRLAPWGLRRLPASITDDYAKNFYDYKMSRALLDHLCDWPAKEVKAVCEGDLSRGPYIFTYAQPASKISPVPPPFLFLDLSDVHERAFPELIASFEAQVKRKDISDRAKIDTLRLKLLSIVLKAADSVGPVQKGMADIVHSASGHTEKDKK